MLQNEQLVYASLFFLFHVNVYTQYSLILYIDFLTHQGTVCYIHQYQYINELHKILYILKNKTLIILSIKGSVTR